MTDEKETSNVGAMRALAVMWVMMAQLADRQVGGRTGQLVAFIVGVIFIVIGALVAAALAPELFPAIANLTGAFDSASTGIAAIDAMLPALAILIGIVIVIGFVLAILRIAQF